MLELSVLGPIQLRGADGHELSAVLAQPKRLALLVYLAAARPRGFQRRDKLVALFWTDFDQARARQALNKAVHVLRRSLGDAAIVSRGDDEIALDDAVVSLDVRLFDADIAAGNATTALARYRGEFADGLYVDDATEFDQWLSMERDRVRQTASRAAGEAADASLAGSATSIELARRALELSPHDELALRRLMLSLRHAGDNAGAAHEYDTFARRLRDELDLAPSPETQALRSSLNAPGGTPPPRVNASASLDQRPEVAAPRTTPVDPKSASEIRAKHRWWPLAAAVVVSIALGGAIFVNRALRAPQSAAPADPHRLVVAALENRTGDSTLDQLGPMTSDWLTQGIVAANLVSVTTSPNPTPHPEAPRQLSASTGAGLVMTGAYYKRRDSVVFEAQLWSAADNAVKQVFQPVTVGEHDVQLALDSLRRQALTIVALAVSPERASSLVRGSPRAPAYEAYREYVQGIDLFAERSPRAYDHFVRAARIDTSFAVAALAVAASLLYDNPTSPVLDSIFTALSAKPAALSEQSRAWLSAMQAARRGDIVESTRLLGELARLAPASLFPYVYAQSLETVGRIREASAALRTMRSSGGSTRFFAYWVSAGMFDDMLGDQDAARENMQEAVREFPRYMPIAATAARYFASTGQLREADSVVDDAMTMATRPGWDAGSVIAVAALEAAGHGHEDWVSHARTRGLAWYNGLSADEREREAKGFGLTWVLYSIQAWPELETRVTQLAHDAPNDPRWIGYQGLIAAHRGDTTSARRAERALAAFAVPPNAPPGVIGFVLQSRARIAAMLGDREGAVELLSRALANGARFTAYLHTEPAFASLRGYEPFTRLVTPH